jgi:hypothetical protein
MLQLVMTTPWSTDRRGVRRRTIYAVDDAPSAGRGMI